MSNIKKSILKGARQALAYAKGHPNGFKEHQIVIPRKVSVRSIRTKLHMNRREFAERFGFSVRTLEKWEQGERQPEGPARAYLTVIAYNPEVVQQALGK